MRVAEALVGLYVLVASCNALVIIDSSLASACSYYMKDFEWGCGGFGTGSALYKCRCANIDWLGSIGNCIEEQADNENAANHAIQHMITRCYQKGGFEYTHDDFIRYYHNASEYLKYPTENDRKEVVRYPLSVNETAFQSYKSSFDEMNHHVFKSQWLGWGLIFYWVAVIVIASIFNLLRSYTSLQLSIPNSVKRYVTLPALFTKHHEDPYFLAEIIPIKIPNRLQSLIVFGFVAQSILSTALSYTITQPNMYIRDNYLMTLDLIGYRSALISFSLLPVVYFFGIRNNPFTWVTGFCHAEFIVFHKCTAIVMALEALIHSAVWTAYAIKDGGYLMWYMDAYWRWGVAGMILISIVIFSGNSFFMTYVYELFLVTHKVLSILFIVTMYYHCVTLGWLGWVYAMAGIYSFDRLVRIIKIVKSGVIQSSRIEKLEDGVIKMTMKKPKYFNYQPGYYAYIYFLNPMYGMWQSHPFTLVSSPVEREGDLVIYYKARGGITSKVEKFLKKFPENGDSIETKIIIEGPYGHASNFGKDQSKNIVAVAGGMGVTSLISGLYEWIRDQGTIEHPYISSSSSGSKVSENEYTLELKRTPKAKLYWLIKNVSYIEWLHEDLNYLAKNNVDVKVIVTCENNDLEKSLLKSNKLYAVKYVGSTVDLSYLIESNIKTSATEHTGLIFAVCGPAKFNDESRRSIVAHINKETPIDVNLKVESFSW